MLIGTFVPPASATMYSSGLLYRTNSLTMTTTMAMTLTKNTTTSKACNKRPTGSSVENKVYLYYCMVLSEYCASWHNEQGCLVI